MRQTRVDKEKEFIQILTKNRKRGNQGLYSGELTESQIIDVMHKSSLIPRLGSSLERSFIGMQIRRNLRKVYAPEKGGRGSYHWYSEYHLVKLTEGIRDDCLKGRTYTKNCSPIYKIVGGTVMRWGPLEWANPTW